MAVDWDPYTQEAYVLTMTPNGPGFGEVWRTDLATYTIRTPITPPQPSACNPTQPFYFTDLAVYRSDPNGNQTFVAIAMNTFFGLGNTGNVDVFDPVTGASVIDPTVGPYCRTNLSYRRIDAGYVQNAVVSGMVVPGHYVAVLPAFGPFFPSGYFMDLLTVPPTANNWANSTSALWACATALIGPENLRPLSVSINREIPGTCGYVMSEVVVGGIQECSASAPAHSYAIQNTASVFAAFALRHSALALGFNRLATDVVVTAGQASAPAPMYAIQHSYHTCNSPAGKLWWFQRECNAGNPVALPDLPLTNVQPVDVAAIQ